MTITKQQRQDLRQIMGVDDDMIRLLPRIEDRQGVMHPWVKRLPGILRGLKFKPGQTILDMPCGWGGVSIPLAKKYGVRVLGYDIVAGYVQGAARVAKEKGVGHQCTFRVEDIRKTVKRKNIADVLLWVAAPHIWPTARKTIQALRNCVKPKGLIVMADAYLYHPAKKYENFETLAKMNRGLTAGGDQVVRFYDYRGSLWKRDFERSRQPVVEALRKVANIRDKKILSRRLKLMEQEEKSDTKYLGLGIWIIKVNKGK